MIEEWNQEAVIEAAREDTTKALETAAGLVEGKARTNLTRISDPAWGRKYRWALAFNNLVSFVQEEKKAVVAYVGMKVFSQYFGKSSEHFGFYIETGSQTAPAQPWLRPALLHNLRNIKRLFDDD